MGEENQDTGQDDTHIRNDVIWGTDGTGFNVDLTRFGSVQKP